MSSTIAALKKGNNQIRGGYRNIEDNGQVAETSIPFGAVVAKGTSDRGCKILTSDTDIPLGVASINHLAYEMAGGQSRYKEGECVDFVKKGITTVLLGAAVTKGQQLSVASDGFTFHPVGVSDVDLPIIAEQSGSAGDVIEAYVDILSAHTPEYIPPAP